MGVEYALISHAGLLKDGGLLSVNNHILNHNPFLQGPTWEILVIDDFVIISTEKAICPAGALRAEAKLLIAEDLYKSAGVLGSDDKTIRGESTFKAVGAEISSRTHARGAGIIGVSGHTAKRVSTAFLSLKLAAMPVITRGLASRLAGQWISILMFRRCLTSTLDGLFALGTPSKAQANDVINLSRATAEELVLASVGGLLAVTDVSAEYDKRIYATDASLARGAVTSCLDK